MSEANSFAEDGKECPKSFIIISNIAKKQNVGNILRSASAFGAEVVIAGMPKFSTFGAKGADKHLVYHYFGTLDEAKDFVHSHGCTIYGIEITDGSESVATHRFSGPSAFILGNEGTGMSPRQKAICDKFLYIPQYGCGTASLNVTVAGSIILHHFALYAKYPERGRSGEKFIVAPRVIKRGEADLTPADLAKRQARLEKRLAKEAAAAAVAENAPKEEVMETES